MTLTSWCAKYASMRSPMVVEEEEEVMVCVWVVVVVVVVAVVVARVTVERVDVVVHHHHALERAQLRPHQVLRRGEVAEEQHLVGARLKG